VLELYLVRHGQTDMSRTHRYCGRIDPPLNEVGVAMARSFGQAYASLNWDVAYCSPRLRTRQTLAELTARRASTRCSTSLAAALLGLDVRLFRDRFAFPLASVTKFELGDAGPTLIALGDTCHLSRELRDAPGS
jgi:broad specificity phosphatase PhoE